MDPDFGQARRRAGNLTARDLARLGEAAGWLFKASRGKGSHGMLLKSGRRGITIPRKLNDRKLVMSVITLIERGTGASND